MRNKLFNLLTTIGTWKNEIIELVIFNVHISFKMSCAEKEKH